MFGDISFLQLLWFALIGVLFSGFFILEGFDFGVGMLHLLMGKNEKERDAIQLSIGHVWDANQVWLLTAGGAMFASYPYWYAALFSGFYLILFLVLVGLILRGVSFIFRAKMPTSRGKRIWDFIFGISSFMAPFFLGVLFTAMVRGMPIDEKGNMVAGFFDYIDFFSLVGGVAVTVLCLLHGLNYLALKMDGDLRMRAKDWARKLYLVLFVGLVLFSVLLFFSTDFFFLRPISTISSLLIIVALSLWAALSVYNGKEGKAFIASSLSFVSLVLLLFVGLFPRVMVSSIAPENSILIANASSSEYTLLVMTIVTVCLLPFVLGYQIFAYYSFSERIKC
ncbi:cytochrome d ubiquinol oxidase subunit II [Treponema phagedenis]|uniref:Cytochrome bd ubiquinol oxidase subunit 2 n=1 Tax=Treponema phagedenis TaxID=162 RepID=A0A0B7GYB8_TREPH|nr:cytochrome d ubiquinol oxidase subunit II [Treponema phagedenis]QSH94858.1 cytochrome d ubiquinol oxidase subunit II [Treponema phagedenis]QSH98658.1 cytochrome d ubiquinol oxidase subunit II [Treponema phagedenis]CEM61955.1 Cytochrome bd ubiquinol oxidase subunit 2 [Treponema phagedenis]